MHIFPNMKFVGITNVIHHITHKIVLAILDMIATTAVLTLGGMGLLMAIVVVIVVMTMIIVLSKNGSGQQCQNHYEKIR